jgi:starch-binding outer membrane protein, SusD/RagB family
MKKIVFPYMLVVAFMAFTPSCSDKDPLDITPDGRISLDDVFKNEKRTEAYLNTVYGSIPSYFWFYQFFAFLAGTTDEAQDADVGNEGSNIAANWITGALTPSSNPLERNGQGIRYTAYWAGIRDANVFLSYVDEANIPNPKNRNRFRAEAKLLRAFYYLEMIKQYGPMPVIDKPFGPAYDYLQLVRPAFQANVDFIVKDCDDALATADLPIRITEASERGRFTQAIAHAIKSQVLLYNASPLWNPSNDIAKWQAASKASSEALTALTASGNYQLFPNYSDYFLSETDINVSPRDKETIFERPSGASGTFTIINSIPQKAGLFKVGSCPSQELVDSYDMLATGAPAILGYSDEDHLLPILNPGSGYNPATPYVGRDPRFYATVWYNGANYDNVAGKVVPIESFIGGKDQLKKTPPNRNNTHTGYYLRKFIDPKLQSNTGHNSRWKKYRLAEIYLNYAEAENEVSGATSQVYTAINTIRTRAGMPNLPTGLSKDAMRERIRRERRVELAIEEHRFWDVRRWKILDKTDKLVTGMEIIKTGTALTYNRFVTERRSAWADKYLIFPIPISDISIIPDFSANQNPGW